MKKGENTNRWRRVALTGAHGADARLHPFTHAKLLFRYASVGAIGTALHYAIFLALLQVAPTAIVLASTTGAFFGACINYWLNRHYSFTSTRPHREALPRFAVVALFGLALNALAMTVLANFIPPLHPLIAQVAATAMVLLTGFCLNRYWTFA